MKNVPMRSCVITKERCEKKNLLRIVRTPEGNIEVDETGKKNGRGAYLKKDVEVINKARQSKILEKILMTEISDSVYDLMLEKIN